MALNGVFFDFYGTLYPFGDMGAEKEEWITELHACLRRCSFTGSRDHVSEYVYRRMYQTDPAKPNDGMSIFERRLQIAASDLGARMTRREIETMAEELLPIWDKYISLDPICLVLLDSLAKRGKNTALISNYDHPKHVHQLVQKDGMKDYFSAVIVSGDHGIKKPDPRIFRLALEQTGMTPGETMFVGDSEEDIVGANRVGMTSVLIHRGQGAPDYGQQHTVSGLQEILGLVELLGG